jgi:hypothetical protein
MTASGCKRLVAHTPSTAVAPRRSVCLVRELRLRVRRFGLSFEARVGHEIMSPWLLPDGTHSGHATLVRLLISHTLSNCGPLPIQLSDPRRPIWQKQTADLHSLGTGSRNSRRAWRDCYRLFYRHGNSGDEKERSTARKRSQTSNPQVVKSFTTETNKIT